MSPVDPGIPAALMRYTAMKKITIFVQRFCPFCAEALGWMDALYEENPAYQALEIEIIDEMRHPIIANKYDYYYVPTYYVGNEKLHEGAASPDIIRRVFDAALAADSPATQTE